jgi:hypothetical protein
MILSAPFQIPPPSMDTLDPAGELLRIAERYRQMSDEELLVLVPEISELTSPAQQALASELQRRGIKVESKKSSAPSPINPPPAFFEHESPKLRDSASYLAGADSPYDEDRKLVELCTVWSVRDALKVQTILDRLGIPFFMGPEKATGVDEVTSNFSNGVGVEIMQVGLPWVGPAMRHYEPQDDPTPKQTEEETDEVMVRCPRCHSSEVIFEGGTSTPIVTANDSSQKFKWVCDSCGQQWEDDGVAKED